MGGLECSRCDKVVHDDLEQGFQEVDQRFLATALEVAELPEIASKDIEKLWIPRPSKLNVADKEILSTRQLPENKEKPRPILVGLKSETLQQQWIDASKENCITVGQIVPNFPKEKADDRLYTREALTKYQRTLLYNAKITLLGLI